MVLHPEETRDREGDIGVRRPGVLHDDRGGQRIAVEAGPAASPRHRPGIEKIAPRHLASRAERTARGQIPGIPVGGGGKREWGSRTGREHHLGESLSPCDPVLGWSHRGGVLIDDHVDHARGRPDPGGELDAHPDRVISRGQGGGGHPGEGEILHARIGQGGRGRKIDPLPVTRIGVDKVLRGDQHRTGIDR